MAMISVRSFTPLVYQKRRANFRHASTASAPLLQKNALCRPESGGQPGRDLPLQRMEEQVRGVDHLARLLGDCVRQPLVPVPERAHADSGKEVEVFAALVVIHTHTLAADQHDGRAAVGLNDVLRLELSNLTCHDARFLNCRPNAAFPLVILVLVPAPAARP